MAAAYLPGAAAAMPESWQLAQAYTELANPATAAAAAAALHHAHHSTLLPLHPTAQVPVSVS